MFVTTHTMVAMTLTAATGNPLIYLPAAAINHPLLDMVPHFGFSKQKYPGLRNKALIPMMVFDVFAGTTLFFLVLFKTGLPFWLLFLVCLLAAWPDLLILYQRFVNPKFAPKVKELHENIQTESPWFFWIELTIIGFCSYLIFY